MILLHAFPLDGSMWGDLAGRRIDYPGHGSLADWADMVSAEMPDPDEVCGLSMGGYAMFELWRRHPGRITRLVLADTRPGPDTAEGRAARDANIEVVRRDGPSALWERVGPTLLRPDPDPAVAGRAQAIANAQPTERLVAMLEALRDRADSTNVLPGISVPVTVICGEHDSITPPGPTREWAAQIPNATVVEIPGAGHLSAMEQPDAFARAVVSSR